MEVILDKLRKNNVDIDMKTLFCHISYFLKQHETSYNQMAARINPDEISIVFAETEVNNFGRAMAYLTLVYVLEIPENAMREAVRLVTTVLKDMDLTVFGVEESFLQRMFSWIRCVFTL